MRKRIILFTAITVLLIALLIFIYGVGTESKHDTKDASHQGVAPMVLNFIKNPTGTFSKGKVPRGVHIIVMSNVAEYLGNLVKSGGLSKKDAKRLLGDLADYAMTTAASPYDKNISNVAQLGRHGLYLAHLNIILGQYKSATGDNRFASINHKISRHLANGSLKDKHYHMPSYANHSSRWPADQAALLYSLALYDRNFGGNLAPKPTKLWLDYMEQKGMSTRWPNLQVSEVTGDRAYSKYPRGCALSWTVRYMAHFSPENASNLWNAYKKTFATKLFGLAAFREYPKGVSFPADTDSGPIVIGFGIAASGLALGAAKSVDDQDTYHALNRLRVMAKRLVNMLQPVAKRLVPKGYEEIIDSIFIRALELNAETQTPYPWAQRGKNRK